MSRRTKARRKARRARALSLRDRRVEPREPWGSGPPLTAEERARVVSRFREMRFRSFTWRLVFMPWVDAKTPEELEDAVRTLLHGKSGN
jgi:hypothetical protein